MKKFLAILTIAALSAVSFAQTNTVSSANIVGYIRTSLPPAGGLTLISVAFDGNGVTLADYLGRTNNLHGDVTVSAADRVYLFNKDTQTYVQYALFDGSAYDQPVEWRLTSDFYTSGEQNPTLYPGEALWLKSGSGVSLTNTLYLSGDVISTTNSSINFVEGLQLVGHLFSSEIDLNDTSLISCGAHGDVVSSGADKVYLWNDQTLKFDIYAYFDGSSYSQPQEWRPVGDFYNAAPAIPIHLGAGFWYNAKSPFTWTETNAYIAIFQ